MPQQIFVKVINLRFLSRTKKGGQRFIFLLPFLVMPNNAFVSQSGIEGATGHGIEQLRKWRQRFGFPPAQYGLDGKAVYSRDTVDRLVVIKRLLEAGFRPRQVVAKTASENVKTLAGLALSKPDVGRSESTNAFINLLGHADSEAFKALLIKQRAKRTMLDFVQHTVTPLMIGIGDAWLKGEIDVFHEHICSSMIERYLIAETLKSKPKRAYPVFLFALPPGERHQLGLLMAEAVMAEAGAYIVNVGTDIPLNSLKLAATACKADVMVLTFSFAYPHRDVLPTLAHLRRLLPPRTMLWAGGAGLSKIKRAPAGVLIMSDFGEAIKALDDLVRDARRG